MREVSELERELLIDLSMVLVEVISRQRAYYEREEHNK